MKFALRWFNPYKYVFMAFAVISIAAFLYGMTGRDEHQSPGKAQIRKGPVLQAVINSPADVTAFVSGTGQPGFTPQVRLGFTSGDQWEPAIAADRFGHVYVLYMQYQGVPGCADCSNPTMILHTSSNHGANWGPPTIIHAAGADTGGQWDPQISVDPIDGRTVYASFMESNKTDIIVAKSTDFGATWTYVTADSTNSGTDKPILAVRGQDVYVVYNHAQTMWTAASHDGGATFTEFKINQNGKLGWSLAGGGTIAPNGDVYFSWAGYEQPGLPKGKVNLYVSKSTDGGTTWTTKVIDVSDSPPDCSAFNCGWAFLGAQMAMTSDSDGALYILWNAGSTAKGPERIYSAKSTDFGTTWSTKQDVSNAAAGTHHAFPAIAATGTGKVRISWMDARVANGGMDRWNTYYRSSTDGGLTWSKEEDLSTFVAEAEYDLYISTDGFSFPYGDYFEMDIDEDGTVHAVWGEGLNWDSPGSIWYSQGNRQ